MKKAKSIEEIFVEIGEADLVITNQAPLATALNRLADRPMIGKLAVTPRELASRMALEVLGEEVWPEAKIVAEVSEATGLEIPYVHGEIENIKEIRRETSQVEKYLDTRDSELVWKAYRRIPSVERAMERFPLDFFEGIDVVVVALDLFDELDKHVLPPPGSFREVLPYHDGIYQIPLMMDMGNERLIGRHIADLIDQKNLNSTAVVLDTEGSILEAVKSALYQKCISFTSQHFMRDMPGIRSLLKFLDFCLGIETAKMSDLKRMLKSVQLKDLEISPTSFDAKYDHHFFIRRAESGNDKELTSLLEYIHKISSGTLLQACMSLLGDEEMVYAVELLKQLGMTESPLTPRTLDTLAYAIDNLSDDIMSEEEDEGVVLVDCKSSTYVDRPIVFHVGIGREWAKHIPRRRHIDSEEVLGKEVTRFEILLQQGEERLYMISKVSKGRKVLPCIYFNRSEARPVLDFEDVAEEVRECRWLDDPSESLFPRRRGSAQTLNTISQSKLNKLLLCPKMYQFSSLTPEPEHIIKTIGNMAHEYAELLVHYPSRSGPETRRECLEVFRNDLSFLNSRKALNSVLAKMDQLMINCEYFLKSYDVEPLQIRRQGYNRLFRAFDLEPTIGNTEFDTRNEELRLNGRIDLRVSENLIVDHKTAKKRSVNETIRRIKGVWDGDEIDVQPLVYLALLRSEGDPRRRLQMDYNYMKPVDSDYTEYDIEKLRVSVIYTGTDRAGLVTAKNPWINEYLNAMNKSEIDLIDEVGSETVLEAFRKIRVWEVPDKGDMEKEKAYEEFSVMFAGKTRKKKPIERLFNRVVEGLSEDIIPYKNALAIMPDVLDSFLLVVKEALNDLEKYSGEGFQAKPRSPSVCKDCEYLDICLEAYQ